MNNFDIFKQLCSKYAPHEIILAILGNTVLELDGKYYQAYKDENSTISNFKEVEQGDK